MSDFENTSQESMEENIGPSGPSQNIKKNTYASLHMLLFYDMKS